MTVVEDRSKLALFNPNSALKPANDHENDFIWSLTEEPHFSRRREILKKHPEIQKLFGYDPMSKWIIAGIVLLQLSVGWLLRDAQSYSTWAFWVLAFAIGGTCNQALFLAIHEFSHNLGFKSIKHNKLFSILVSNVPIAVPYAASFKPYHMDHHKYQGVEGVDTDIPSAFEAWFFNSTAGKVFFSFFQIMFYALRPMLTYTQPFTWYHLLNLTYILALDAVFYFIAGPGMLFYFVASSFLAGCGLHPCASHFIAEHYVFSEDWETYSYYGLLNIFCFNVGYHNEHHDFPNIPGSRLPMLRKLASEYYDNLPYHESWPMVTWKFITDSQVSLYSRVKRKGKISQKMASNISHEEKLNESVEERLERLASQRKLL